MGCGLRISENTSGVIYNGLERGLARINLLLFDLVSPSHVGLVEMHPESDPIYICRHLELASHLRFYGVFLMKASLLANS